MSWNGLGAILGRLEGRLGVKIVLPCRVALVFLKIDFLEKMRVQEATWAELRPTWAPKRVPNGAQKRAKTEAKKEMKNEVKLGAVRSGK